VIVTAWCLQERIKGEGAADKAKILQLEASRDEANQTVSLHVWKWRFPVAIMKLLEHKLKRSSSKARAPSLIIPFGPLFEEFDAAGDFEDFWVSSDVAFFFSGAGLHRPACLVLDWAVCEWFVPIQIRSLRLELDKVLAEQVRRSSMADDLQGSLVRQPAWIHILMMLPLVDAIPRFVLVQLH
jgi:hypothetical protein